MSTDLSSIAMVELVLESQSLSELAERLIPDLMRRTGAEGGSVLIRKNGVLVVQTAFGLKKSRAEQAEIPLGVGVTGRAAQSGNIQWVPDVSTVDNFIEGVPDSTWEFAVPIEHDQRDTAMVIDLESNTEDRPSNPVRNQILNDLESIELPMLNLAENERFRGSVREDSFSSLIDGEYFFNYMRDWVKNNPSREGLLMVMSLQPDLDTQKISSLRDLRGEIRTIGTQIRTELSDQIIATRLYGNLFCLFIPDVKKGDAEDIVNGLHGDLEEFCTIEKLNYAHWARGNEEFRDLTNKAFVELDFTQTNQHPTHGFKLDDILHEGDIELSQQPILDPVADSVYGREILVRGPENSDLQSPKRLFETAYQEERVVSLDTLITRRALKRFETKNGLTLFLNVERKTLVEDQWRQELIDLMGSVVDGPRVCIEITEHGNMQNLEEPMEQLRDELGGSVKFAIDDFGTGASNFEALIDLNPDILKIDRSLIRNINKDFGKRSFIDSILNFSSTTRTTILAEGIEKEAEWKTLRDLGVELAQGYYFAKPQKIDNGRFTSD